MHWKPAAIDLIQRQQVAFVRMLTARMCQEPWFYSDKRNIRQETCGEYQMFAFDFFTQEEKKRIMLQVILDFLNMMETIYFKWFT